VKIDQLKKEAHNTVKLGWFLFLRDFRYRFRQTYFGYIWAVIKPLLSALPIIIVGNQFDLAKNNPLQVNYAVFSFVGLMLWQVFWDSIVFPQWMLRRTRSILKRVPFKYWAVVLAGCFYVLFNLLIYIVLTAMVLIIYKISPPWTVFLSIFALIPLILSGLSIGIFIAPLTLVYLDLRYSLPTLASILLWSVPVAYVTPDKGLLSLVNRWNPLTFLINTPRAWLISGFNSSDWLFLLSFTLFFALFLGSVKFYKRAMPLVVEQIV